MMLVIGWTRAIKRSRRIFKWSASWVQSNGWHCQLPTSLSFLMLERTGHDGIVNLPGSFTKVGEMIDNDIMDLVQQAARAEQQLHNKQI
jgi:hypothetical protein